MAHRFQIYLKRSNRVSDPDNKRWEPSEHDVKLIQWLEAQLGRSDRSEYKLPMSGPGWLIAEGHEHDANLYDYAWRRVMGTQYQPQGKYGIWLEIDNEDVAVMLRLSGLLEERPRGHRMFPDSLDYDPNYWDMLYKLIK